MDHAEFVEMWKASRVEVRVDRSKAYDVIDMPGFPKRYRNAYFLWTWVWILSIPGAIAVGFFVKWWVGLLMLVVVSPALSRACKKSLAQFMIDHALEESRFFDYAVDQDVIHIAPKA